MVLEDKNKLEMIFLDYLQVVIGDSPRIWLDDCAIVQDLVTIYLNRVKNMQE